jgi:mono/diheme cytochrome c family protein
MIRASIAAAAVVCAAAVSAVALANAATGGPAVFTPQQASAGRAAYAKNCGSCHMPDLSGNNEVPPLAGVTFMSIWQGRSTKDLRDYMAASMPYGGASLDAETYTVIAAYLLSANGAAAGSSALASDTSARIGGLACAAKEGTTIDSGCAPADVRAY